MKTPSNHVPAAAVAKLETLYNQGKYASAHDLGVERHGPLTGWSGTAALVFGYRLAGNLGGDRLAHTLILRANRQIRRDPEARAVDRVDVALFLGYRTVGRRGPLALRRFLRRPGVRAAMAGNPDAEKRADFLCLEAHVAAAFRDTDRADSLWQEARDLAADRPWTWCERASLLVSADRYPEALDAARESLRLQPWFRPAVQQAAQTLTLLGRDEEAITLLENALDPAHGGLESAAASAQLAVMYAEALRPGDALRALDRYEALSPLLEKEGQQWLASRRSEAKLLLDDLPGSAEAAEPLVATSFFYEKTVPRLRDPERQQARRVVLPVPFVRQHERTCAPATLAALTRFWQRPCAQEDITREICYGGTFDHLERHWAETHGWTVREFRADWASSVALIDAGVPFTVVTTGINSGHLQAVIGYDARRGTLVIRDPYERNQSETLAEEFFERYAFNGPRAMAFVPGEDAATVERLQGAELPEAALHDGLYRQRRALHAFDRNGARAALEAMHAMDPDARLTLIARDELARYDGDEPDALAAVDALIERFPKEGRLKIEKLYLLRRLARPVEARAWLEACAADRTQAEPNLWRELARDLAADARERPRARLLLARSLFYQPVEAEHLRALGEAVWDAGDRAEAAALFRLAATAAGTREDYWQQFFVASRHLRTTDESLRLLQARFERLGGQSSQPGRTLYWARKERHEFAPAATVLDEALARRPEDGDLLLFAATALARDGEHARAAGFLERAQGHAAPGTFARAAAELADLADDLPGALARWREVLDREPRDTEAHRHVARLLEETDPRGPTAARLHLDEAVARFPHAVGLHEIRIAALAEDLGRGTTPHREAVAALLAVQPTNVWAHRESALACAEQNDLPGAFAALDEAERLDPAAAPTHALRGRLHRRAGHLPEARASLRRALELDAGSGGSLEALLDCCPTLPEKREALDYMHGLLLRQAFVGQAILTYRMVAYALLKEGELLTQLEGIVAERPDLWQAWSALGDQHAAAGRLDQAQAQARTAAERFPLLPIVWMDLAGVEKLRGDAPAEIDALERALRIRSAYGDASRQLAQAHRRAERFAEARRMLEQAIAAAPLDVSNRGALADTLWEEDKTAHGKAVLDLLVDALRREPGYGGGWNALEYYARLLGQPEVSEATARLLTTTRPGEARSWMRLAQTLPGEKGTFLDERLVALDRALALNPRLNDAYDLRAVLLTRVGRYEDALAACEPPPEVYPGGTRPFVLAGRAAWVRARRGDLAGACEQMREVLADHPGYGWGWRMLADWTDKTGDWEENLRAAEQLAFLSPHAAPPLGYLAAARLKLKQRAEARDALREAMRREPDYLYAPTTLLGVQLEDNDLADAEETLRFLEKHHPGAPTLGRTVLIAAKQKQRERAAAALTALAQTRPAPGTDDGNLPGAVRAMLDEHWEDAVELALGAALRVPTSAHPEAGTAWVRVRAERKKWKGLAKTIRGLPEGEFARQVRGAYLTALTERRVSLNVILFVRRMRQVLCADTASWGQVGYAFTGCGLHRRAVRWMADWRTRPGVESWMLLNLASSLRTLGRHDQAVAVNRHALTLPPDHTRPKHLAWVAVEDALTDGEPSRARAERWYVEIAPQIEKQAQPFRYLNVLAGQTLVVRQAEGAEAKRTAYRLAVGVLKKERRPVAGTFRQNNLATYRAERRVRRRMARDAEMFWSRVGVWLFVAPASTTALSIYLFIWMAGVAAALFGGICLVAWLTTP